jgi:hypothetical protein
MASGSTAGASPGPSPSPSGAEAPAAAPEGVPLMRGALPARCSAWEAAAAAGPSRSRRRFTPAAAREAGRGGAGRGTKEALEAEIQAVMQAEVHTEVQSPMVDKAAALTRSYVQREPWRIHQRLSGYP